MFKEICRGRISELCELTHKPMKSLKLETRTFSFIFYVIPEFLMGLDSRQFYVVSYWLDEKNGIDS